MRWPQMLEQKHFKSAVVRKNFLFFFLLLSFFLDESQEVAIEQGGLEIVSYSVSEAYFYYEGDIDIFCTKIKNYWQTEQQTVFVFYTSHNLLNRDVAIL